MERLTLLGRVTSGLGQGAFFTQLDWAREQFVTQLGIDPYPGTLNLIVDGASEFETWASLKATRGDLVIPPAGGGCNARCYPIRIRGWLPGAIVFPEVAGYPPAQVEIIAALPIRETLSLADGDSLRVEISQPLPVRAAIFDVDGTLVDSLEAYRVVAELAAAPYGIAVPREAVRQALNTNQLFWEIVLPPDQSDRAGMIARLRETAVRLWPEVLDRHGRLCLDVRTALEILRARGARLGIVTGSREGTFAPLRADGLMDFFSVVVTGRDVARRKPDPEGLLKCTQALGVEPSEAVYVGDTPADIQASRAAGMAAVGVLSGAGDSGGLSAEGPDRIIHSLAHLPEILEIR